MSARARLELRLGRDSSQPLAELDVKPDPLAPVAAVLAALGPDEWAELTLDLLPLTARQRRRALRRAIRTEPAGAGGVTSAIAAASNPLEPPRRSSTTTWGLFGESTLARLEDHQDDRRRHDKLASPDATFAAQLLLSAEAPTRDRARMIVRALAAALDQWEGHNYWRPTGAHVGPWWIGGADSRLHRRFFDLRHRTGLFRPPHRSVVGATEILGLLKPPTRHCGVPGLLRSGGLVPPAPAGLPRWERGAGLVPLGQYRPIGRTPEVGALPARDLRMTVSFGMTRSGKTEQGVNRALALAENGDAAVLFLDPHASALKLLRRHLVHCPDRVLDVDLSQHRLEAQAGLNLLSMEGAGPEHIGDKADTFAGAMAAVYGWSDQANTRALNLATQAAAACCELNLVLPPDLAATVFQIPTLLTDERWRDAVLPWLSPQSRDFLRSRLSTQTGGKEATSPVTNPIDRLRRTRSVAAFLGQSRTTFNLRAALDDCKVVLLCPGGTSAKARLVHALLLFHLHEVIQSRIDDPAVMGRPVYAFVDELQVGDRGQGSVLLQAMLQEDGKFGLWLQGMVQQPTALQTETRSALLTNCSMICANTLGAEDVAPLTRQWGKVVEPEVITRLPAYTYLAQVTLGRQPSQPFLLRGRSVEELWGPGGTDEEVSAFAREVDRHMRRQRVEDVLHHIDTLDARIVEHLRGLGGGPGQAEPPPRRSRQKLARTPLPAGVADLTLARGRRPWTPA